MARVADPFEVEMLAAMPALRRLALSLTRAADRADDLVQDTLMKGWAARDSFTLGTNMKAWLCFIARNRFLSGKRRAWRAVQMPMLRGKNGDELSLADTIPSPSCQFEKVALDDLLEAVSYLPAEMREAVLLAGEGLAYEEMADELGISVGTVKSRVSRGRAQLEAYFGLNIENRRAA